MPIRVHDFRATFVTVNLAHGKSETRIADRTGHRSSQMINTYRRQARTWTELGVPTLAAMDITIPRAGARRRGHGGLKWRRCDPSRYGQRWAIVSHRRGSHPASGGSPAAGHLPASLPAAELTMETANELST